MTKIDWDRVASGVERERHRMIWRPYGLPRLVDLESTAFHDEPISAPWEIPSQLGLSVAITGAFFGRDQNPNQPISTEEVLGSAREAALAGASSVHIHVRDDRGYESLSLDLFRAVIEPLRYEFPSLSIDGCLVPSLPGEWEEMVRVLGSGLLDATPVNATATYLGDSLFAKPAPILLEKTRLVVEAGLKPEIAIYTDGDVSNADRYLLRSGLIAKPATWIVLPALPGCAPMNNPMEMVDTLTHLVRAVRNVDPLGIIVVCAAGRASMHLATLAASMGLHIRVGMEDTYWTWPHRADLIQSNAELVRLGQALASVVGRSIASPEEYRSLMGLPSVPRVR